ncbi:protoporphyrinogen/coproporphyrinogen oxidase [Citricoccus sp. GCM10030269]|uniref:protoporphyrinogen/coproporphyrinogen oxidase n=1 Tax=Citricoccus sp. GCM10030269 TaxID=3273388 RepID=UPI00360D1691
MTEGTASPPAATGGTTAVVIGGGIAGLLAAWELTRSGHRVTLVEAREHLGGSVSARSIRSPEGRDIALDAGAESFAVRTPAVRALIEELGLGSAVVEPNPAGSWLFLGDRAVKAPRLGILGIPGDLDAPEVSDALGAEAMTRARRDVDAPAASLAVWRQALHDGGPVTVASIVRDRMGEGVLRTLVAPVVGGVHSADPDDVDVRTVAPGLLEALVAEGSLSRAVRARRAAAPPGAAVASLRGGMHTLTAALIEALRGAGARLLTGTEAVSLSREGRRWTVTLAGAGAGDGGAATSLPADRVVVATDGPRAWDLLAPVSNGALTAADRPEEGAGVALVTLVVKAPGLDAHPRGTGLLVSPDVSHEVVGAKALTHVTAKWGWVREELPAHHHVLRLSYGRVTDAPDSAAPGYRTPADTLRRQGFEDASRLTGVDLTGAGAGSVVEPLVVRWKSALPAATTEHRERVRVMRTWLENENGLDALGAWLAGTGLAAVVADVRQRMARGSAVDGREG